MSGLGSQENMQIEGFAKCFQQIFHFSQPAAVKKCNESKNISQPPSRYVLLREFLGEVDKDTR